MPTYITTHTGGTPTTRAASLLSTALSQLDPSSPAYSTLVEAHSLVAGEETYIERNTSELIVPAGHAVLEQEVREVWDELLRGTTETDWKAVKDREETTFELGAGMVSATGGANESAGTDTLDGRSAAGLTKPSSSRTLP